LFYYFKVEEKSDAPLHPTARLLVDTVVGMLKTMPFDDIKSQVVLQRSGISRGPMYYHFKNFEELVETAQLELYQSVLENVIRDLNQALSQSSSIEEARAGLSQIGRVSRESSAAFMRIQRIGLVYSAATSKQLSVKFKKYQENLTQGWMHLYETCVEKGWADPDLQSRPVAILLQSLIIGRAIDDLGEVQMDIDAWVDVPLRLIDSFFLSEGDK
jgi:AcrR family transcriptional regulator